MEYESDPWGEGRADWRSGIIASTIANRHRGPSEQRYKVADFLPHFGEQKPVALAQRQSPEVIQALLMQWAEA